MSFNKNKKKDAAVLDLLGYAAGKNGSPCMQSVLHTPPLMVLLVAAYTGTLVLH